jgi:hypothetical protein
MNLKVLWEFCVKNWGNLASVIGLFISFATLLVAQKAKQSADAAKLEARRRSLAEERHAITIASHDCERFALPDDDGAAESNPRGRRWVLPSLANAPRNCARPVSRLCRRPQMAWRKLPPNIKRVTEAFRLTFSDAV